MECPYSPHFSFFHLFFSRECLSFQKYIWLLYQMNSKSSRDKHFAQENTNKQLKIAFFSMSLFTPILGWIGTSTKKLITSIIAKTFYNGLSQFVAHTKGHKTKSYRHYYDVKWVRYEEKTSKTDPIHPVLW